MDILKSADIKTSSCQCYEHFGCPCDGKYSTESSHCPTNRCHWVCYPYTCSCYVHFNN